MLGNKLKGIGRGAVIGALLTTAAGIVLLKSDFTISKKLLHASYNLPFRHRAVIKPDEVVMVYMNDDAHRELEQPYNGPWDRGVHARLVERLTLDGAKAIVFDILFSGQNPDHPEGDEAFARAIKANGKVVLGAEYGLTPEKLPTLYPPYYRFFEVAAAVGFVELSPDEDFTVRRHLHVPPEKEADSYSSLTWESAKLAGASVALDDQARFPERWLNYYGPPGTIPAVSFHRVLDTNAIPLGIFSNKVVFVGSALKTDYSGRHKDEYYTPYSDKLLGPAIDQQATQFLNLLRGDWLNRSAAGMELVLVILAGLVFGIGLTIFRPLIATIVACGSAFAVTQTAFLVFAHSRVWFPWLIIVAAQIPIALFWSIVFNSIQLYVQNKLYEASLALYLSPKLVKKFASDKELLKPGAKKETLTILFSDIASFTSISEGMDSDQLAKDMNTYFEVAVSQCVHHTDGTIVKYIGDAIFAFWNAPDPQNDHQFRACEAALRFRDQPPQFMNGQQLITRIGLHTGVANVGNFGSRARVDYTALGENINLASRMESFNKYMGTEVLLTGETQAGVAGRVVTRFLGSFRLKGFERNVEVHELVGLPEKAEASRPLREAFAAAVKRFKQRDFDGAKQAFEQILETAPNDGPTKFYLKHLADLKAHPVPDDWEGEIELKEK